MSHMEQLAIFEEKVALSPGQLHGNISSFDDVLMRKLREQLEGKCSKHGFVVPGSLKLLSRSYGYMERGTFTADVMYYIKAEGTVYNPPNGTIVEGVVIRKSKAGLYVILKVAEVEAIHIMIVRDLHIGNVEFDSVELGETIRIEIKKSRFQIHDPHILSIGQFLGRVGDVAPMALPLPSDSDSDSASASASAEPEPEPEAEPAEEEEAEESDEEDQVPDAAFKAPEVDLEGISL